MHKHADGRPPFALVYIVCMHAEAEVAVQGVTIKKSSVYTSVYTQKPQAVVARKIKFCVRWYSTVGASENHFKSTRVATPQLAGHTIRKYAHMRTGTAIDTLSILQ